MRLQPCAPLLAYRPPVLLAILPDDPELLLSLAAALGPRCAVGSGTPLAASTQVSGAARQAQLAAAQAVEAGRRYPRYGTGQADTGFLPGSVEDDRPLVRRIPGPLVEYGRVHDGNLVTSLRTFLATTGLAAQRRRPRRPPPDPGLPAAQDRAAPHRAGPGGGLRLVFSPGPSPQLVRWWKAVSNI